MAQVKILILGGSFAGLQIARHIRDYMTSDDVDITVVDRKSYLLFIPNIPLEVFDGKDPNTTLQLPLASILDKDGTHFIQADVTGIDLDNKQVSILPSERPGAAADVLSYDYLVIALGNRLAFDKIEGFAEYGQTLTDGFYGNKFRHYLYNGDYKGGPIAIGSARFHQGIKGKLDFIPEAMAACEGPPVETALSLASWLENHEQGGPKNITIFTPAKLIAEDAGEKVVAQLLELAGGMGFGYKNNMRDISRITKDGIEFANGESLEAELKIIFPDWVPHAFLIGLPICDETGFVITNREMRNPDYPEVFAAGDAAAVTVPKLGSIGHHQSYIVARQIAKDIGYLDVEEADKELYNPEVICYGDMGNGKGFYIHSNSWYGGETQILKMGKFYYDLKVGFKSTYFMMGGKVPHWQWKLGTWAGDKV
ncbi:MAG: pyridine nucleotide-disulfide oxidoreductase [Chlorobium sp.]|nr:MAG: pyridine nucleotide-disulfide oxidoreductase [Chlorobium sp.]